MRSPLRRGRGSLLVALAASLVLGACTYGPVQDHSRFVDAAILDDGRVLFTYHRYRYRPATGIAAFPDGGIPRYVVDRHGVAVLDPSTGSTSILEENPNLRFTPGQGRWHIQETAGDLALLSRGGQDLQAHRKGGFELVREWVLLDVVGGTLQSLSLEEEMRERGRAVGQIRHLAADGSLVLLNPSLEERDRHVHWYRERSVVPEVWLREPEGRWVRVGATRHLERISPARIVWWNPDDRRYRAYLRDEGRTVLLGRDWRPPARKDSLRAASVPMTGEAVHLTEGTGEGRRRRVLLDRLP